MPEAKPQAEFEDSGTLEEMEEQLLNELSADDKSGTDNEDEVLEGSSDSDDEPSQEEDSQEEKDRKQELILGRFKTQEELAEAYRNLEVYSSRRNNELHKLKQQVEQKSQKSPQEETEEFAQRLKKNPVKALRDLVREELQPVRHETMEQRANEYYSQLSRAPDFQELQPVMGKISEEMSDLIQGKPEIANDPRVLDLLYWAARGINSQMVAQKSETVGRQKGAASQQKKMRAKLEGASGGEKKVKKDFDSLSIEDMEKELASQGLA